MKKKSGIMPAAILLFAAFLLTGCPQPGGGGGYPGSSIINVDPHDLSVPDDEPGENTQNDSSGEQQTTKPNDQENQSSDEEDTETPFARTVLTNTTWYFEKSDYTDNSCEREHYQTTQNPDDGQSGEQGSYTEPTIVSTSTEDKSRNYDTPYSKYYLHVDSNNNAFFGVVSWDERGTEYWKEETITYSNGQIAKDEVENSYRKVISYSGDKTFTPAARGTVQQNQEDSTKLSFNFPYANIVINANSNTGDKKDMYLSVNTVESGLLTTKLIKNSEGQGYDKVTPTINNNKLRLVYFVKSYTCGQLAPDGINKCGNTYSDDYYTIWEKADFSEAMLTADIVKDKESIRNKVFMKKDETFTAGNSYDYYCFYKDGFIKVKDLYEFWGNDTFVETNETSSSNKKAYIVSQKNGKYYLNIKDDDSNFYCFTDAAENATQDFSEYYSENYSEKTYYKSISAIPYTDRLLKNNKLEGNKYKYKKGFEPGKIWYEQAATWSDTDGNKLECTGISAEELQTYALTLDGAATEIKDIAKAADDKYIILLEAKSVILQDKKDGTIIIKDGDKQYTLNYASRYGYKDDDFVEIDLTFENTEAKFADFDHNGSNYKLPKTITVNKLRELYKALPEIKTAKVGFDYLAFDKKDGSLIADTVKAAELNPKTLYIATNKNEAAFDITLAYKGSYFCFSRHKLYDSYNVEVIENLGDQITVPGNNPDLAREPVFTQTVKITVMPETTGRDLKELFINTSQKYAELKLTYGANKDVLNPESTLSQAGIKQGDTITVSETQASDFPSFY